MRVDQVRTPRPAGAAPRRPKRALASLGMTDVRMIVAWGPGADLTKDWFSNTLYFAVDLPPTDPVDYQSLADDLRDIYAAQSFTVGSKIEVRAYNMGDDKPRPEKAYSSVVRAGGQPSGPHQVALCLSYYSERNLPRQRGRIYLGPFAGPVDRPDSSYMTSLLDMAESLGGLGGINVDWSVYSPTTAEAGGDPTMSISDAWVDNSWDIVRSRKQDATTRQTRHIGE